MPNCSDIANEVKSLVESALTGSGLKYVQRDISAIRVPWVDRLRAFQESNSEGLIAIVGVDMGTPSEVSLASIGVLDFEVEIMLATSVSFADSTDPMSTIDSAFALIISAWLAAETALSFSTFAWDGMPPMIDTHSMNDALRKPSEQQRGVVAGLMRYKVRSY